MALPGMFRGAHDLRAAIDEAYRNFYCPVQRTRIPANM